MRSRRPEVWQRNHQRVHLQSTRRIRARPEHTRREGKTPMATHLHHAHWHADHVGSLLRPAALLEARTAYADGRLDLEALRQSEDRAVLDALRLQRDVGLEI